MAIINSDTCHGRFFPGNICPRSEGTVTIVQSTVVLMKIVNSNKFSTPSGDKHNLIQLTLRWDISAPDCFVLLLVVIVYFDVAVVVV